MRASNTNLGRISCGGLVVSVDIVILLLSFFLFFQLFEGTNVRFHFAFLTGLLKKMTTSLSSSFNFQDVL